MIEPDSCFNEKLPNTPYSIRGYSRSGVGTVVQVPELGWAFDCGMVPDMTPVREVFITHNHIDHVLCAPFILYLDAAGAPVHFHMPSPMVAPFKEYITSVADLAFAGKPSEAKKRFLSLVLIHGIPTDRCDEFRTDERHFVRTFKTFHTAFSIGYAIYELNERGAFEPLLIYTGDAKADWIEASVGDIAAGFKVIITECSFLDYHPNCDKYNHTQWKSLEPYVKRWSETTFVLIHTSLRYDHHKDTKKDISLEMFKKYNNYKNLLVPTRKIK